MSRPLQLSLAVQLRTLRESISENLRWPSPEAGFARMVLSDLSVLDGYPFLSSLPKSDSGDRLQEAPILAASGYVIAEADAATQQQWAKSLERLSGRDLFPADRASFFFRPVELLGISLGTAKCPSVGERLKRWLQTGLASGEQRIGEPDFWSFHLSAYAGFLQGVFWKSRPFADLAVEDLAAGIWLWLAAPAFAKTFVLKELKDLTCPLLQKALVDGVPTRDVAREAAVYASLHKSIDQVLSSHYEQDWQIGRPSIDAIELVKKICSRFHVVAQQLRNRRSGRTPFALKDEYDVQYLMHGLLRLYFDDIRPEEWCPSYAGMSSRIDFLLKTERIVIETKMTRKALDERKLGEELTLDKAKYRTSPDCGTLVCFVYDPDGYCRNPAALERDLAEDREEFRVIVVVAPKGT